MEKKLNFKNKIRKGQKMPTLNGRFGATADSAVDSEVLNRKITVRQGSKK